MKSLRLKAVDTSRKIIGRFWLASYEIYLVTVQMNWNETDAHNMGICLSKELS